MNWEGFRYKDIAETISNSDIDNLIDVMIDNYDKDGKWYEEYNLKESNSKNSILLYLLNRTGLEKTSHAFDFISKNAPHLLNTLNLIDKTARQEIEKEGSINYDPFWFTDSQYKEINIESRIEKIGRDILIRISKVAKQKRNDRIFYRLPIGEIVDLSFCTSHSPFNGKIEFCKDGGWGIADKEGYIIVKNHLVEQPSNTHKIFNKENCPYRLIQDRDTELYGVLSLETFKEVIHCIYEEIEVAEYQYSNTKKHFLKVKKNEKWGCYDEDCSFIIDCKYDDINIIAEWIEGCRDGDFLYSEIDFNKYNKIYEGFKDLYDTEGRIMLSGYNLLEYEYGQCFKFYFGTKYESYIEKETTIYNDVIDLQQYRINYDKSQCLVLDRHFRTIFKNNGQYTQIPLGEKVHSKQELEYLLPNDLLLSGYVDLSDWDSFIYLKRRNAEKFIASNYIEEVNVEFFGKKIYEPGYWVDEFIEDDEVTILRIAKNKSILWSFRANEIGNSRSGLHLYRLSNKVGFFSYEKISNAMYSAISTDFQDKKTYIAQKQRNEIFFFEMNEIGELIELEDFNPQKHSWFPNDFLSKNGLIEYVANNYYNDDDDSPSYEKYGGYNGYDDDTIDYGFDGHPEATWNVD